MRVLRDHAGRADIMAVVKKPTATATVPARWPGRRCGPASPNSGSPPSAGTGLRRDGIAAPVLAWLHPPGTDFARTGRRRPGRVASVGRSPTCSTRSAHRSHGGGHHQGGDRPEPQRCVSARDFPDVLEALRRASAADAVRVRGIMSHLACGMNPTTRSNDLQAQRFTAMISEARRRGIEFEVAHLSNSPRR